MLPICTPSDVVYRVHGGADGLSTGFSGGSPAEACTNFAVGSSSPVAGITEHTCNVVASPAPYAIYKVCDAQPQFTSEKIADMATLWGMFLLAAIAILCVRKLFNIFDKAPHAEG